MAMPQSSLKLGHNIRFNHGFEVFNVGCGSREAEGINIDRGP